MAQKLSNLPVGSLVKFGKHQVGSETEQPIIWMIADKNHSGYPSDSVTLITQKIIDLRAYDARETNQATDDEDRGNPDYGLSNINQWLNSDASAGKWYSKTHQFDASPDAGSTRYDTPYDERAGFLYNFTQDERLALLPTTLVVQDASDVSETIIAKVFLPSLWETIGTHSWADGSTRLACFKSGVVTCGLTSQAFTNTTSTKKPSSTSVNWLYMTRSTRYIETESVSATGTSVSNLPYDGDRGLRPVINLSANAKISDTADSDGCYTVSVNNAPTISGTNTDLGTRTTAFANSYTITDRDSDKVTVKEYIDDIEVRSYVATLGATNQYSVTGNTWLTLPNGLHTIKIVATDGFDTATRVITFTKKVEQISVKRASPIPSTTRPTRLIATVVKTIPTGAVFRVEACNNGYDTTPTWEDITSEVTSGFVHVFSNTACTAGRWGVNIQVTVNRNSKAGACFISEIGGNFE